MHDPLTVAFDIKRPWPHHVSIGKDGRKWKHYPSLITIWHRDPEKPCRGRRDDSCGWFTPPISEADHERAKAMGRQEYKFLFGEHGYRMNTLEAVIWVWGMIGRQMHGRRWRRWMTHDELTQCISLAVNPTDNLRSSIEARPGNFATYDFPGIRSEEDCAAFFALILRCYRRHHRPWWRHPRWHFWHWRIQIPALQKLWRWLFHRCSICGGRFKYGESPTGSWSGDAIWHSACDTSRVPHVAPADGAAD